MCGEDHQTYLNECAMLSRGVEFAYYGPCKDECGDDYSQVSSLNTALNKFVPGNNAIASLTCVKCRQDTSRSPPMQ